METCLTEIVLEAEAAPVASKNRMAIPTPLTEHETNIDEEDLEVPWSCEEVDPFTPRIRNFKSSLKTRMPNNVKTYDGTGDPGDHVKIFQAATQVERWAMPTWCHMFNSTLTRTARLWFDELPPKSIDGYTYLKATFLAYFMQRKKYVKDPVEIHNIKQNDGETIEEFMERFKIETGRMKGAPECMRIYGFMHGVNNLELIKRLDERVPKTLEEMMTATVAFIRGETAAASKNKVHTPWKSHEQSKRQNPERRSEFSNQPREGRGSNKFTPLTRTPKEIFAVESGKFKPPPPMITPVEKRSINKFCEFHNDKGHNTDKCVQLRKQIEELPWQRVTRQKVTQSFAHVKEIMFPPLISKKGTGGPLVIEAEISGHSIHRIYVDGGSSMEVLYEHCFNQLWPEIKSQMVLETMSLTGFSGETIWQLGQLRLLVTIGDAEHYTKAWMNFMIVRSPSSYNDIIRRHGIREIQAVPSTAHGMLKFPVNGGIVTIRSTISTPTECTTITATPKDPCKKAISAVLMTERDIVQTPVYFVSQALQAPELNYTPMEKLVLALVGVAKRLRRYFHALTIMVITDQPIKQILADFLVENPDDSPPEASVIKTLQEPWTLFTDGSSCVDGSCARLISTSLEGTEFTYALRFQFAASNNEAEYEALIDSLRIATQAPRSKNKKEDAMGKITSTSFAHLSKQVLVGVLKEKSIQEEEVATVVEEEGPTWMTPIMEYLKDGTLLSDRKVASKLRIKARQVLITDASGGESSGFSTRKSARIWPFADIRERANRSLGEGIKARLSKGNNNWIEELPYVLWAHRTMIKTIHGDTLFSLTYGTEAVIPVEIGMPTYRTAVVDAVHNNKELQLNLDLLEERRECAAICEANAKVKMTKYYNTQVRDVTFRPGDFVYRSNEASHALEGGKLGLKWEGPYEVTEALRDGAYMLRSRDGAVLPRT
nr:reverse transcriptase domain-containing protein [Tanacetum cinerariifolium]